MLWHLNIFVLKVQIKLELHKYVSHIWLEMHCTSQDLGWKRTREEFNWHEIMPALVIFFFPVLNCNENKCWEQNMLEIFFYSHVVISNKERIQFLPLKPSKPIFYHLHCRLYAYIDSRNLSQGLSLPWNTTAYFLFPASLISSICTPRTDSFHQDHSLSSEQQTPKEE